MSYYITPEQYEIAESNGISYKRIYERVYGYGWNPEEACVIPPQKQRRGLWHKWGHLATYNRISRQQFQDRVRENNKYMSCYEAATRPIKRRVKNG